MKNSIFMFIFCSAVKLVCLQEITESSGETSTSTSSITSSVHFLNSETASSGEGPISIDLNSTDFDEGENFSDGEFQSVNETTTESTTTSPSVETTTPSTTQTTTDSTTTSTTPTTTTVLTTISTTMSPTTTSTTKEPTSTIVPSTSTTVKTTTKSITQRPTTTTTLPTTRKTTQMPPIIPVTKSHENQEEAPCEFVEKDLVCDTELNCFGEGTVDCTVPEEEMSPIPVAPKPSSTLPLEDTDEYEDGEESATIGFFPSELIGKVPPRFSFPWHMKSADVDIPDPLTDLITTTTVDTPTTTSPISTTSVPLTTVSETTQSSTAKLTSSVSSTFDETSALTTVPSTEFEDTTLSKNISVKSSTTNNENVTLTNAAESTGQSSTSSILVSRIFSSGTEPVTSQYNNNDNSSETATEIRVKRDSNKMNAPSSSESLKLTIQDSNKQGKTCKITGNVHCITMPSTAFCRGKATCRVISVEKTEKSSSSKGVENWAIAVIAICATAAALTIGLLVYLVVTSWKKLKVQPQNGVTTLNYVNSSPP